MSHSDRLHRYDIDAPSKAAAPRRTRPFGVPAIAVLQVVTSASAIAGWWASDPLDADIYSRAVYLSSTSVALAILGLFVAASMLLMARWAWPLILFVLSIQLALGLWAYYQGHPNFVTMALSAVAIFYLNSRDVRRAFGYVRARETVPIE